jgi:hypothetical protein
LDSHRAVGRLKAKEVKGRAKQLKRQRSIATKVKV